MQIDHPRKLAQATPNAITPIPVWHNNGTLAVEITKMILTVTSVSGANTVHYAIYHDDNGFNYDPTTILFFDQFSKDSQEPGALFQSYSPCTGICVQPGGSIGFEIDTAHAAALTLYGGELIG